MKTRNAKLLTIFLVGICLLNSASAFHTSESDYLDFSDWDHSMITNGGQTFEDICGDIDVTVTASGDFTAPSEYQTTIAGGLTSLQTALEPGGNQTFTFSFSEPVPLVLDIDLLDTFETLEVTSDGSTTYIHDSGSFPTLTQSGGTLTLSGTAVGAGPDGAAIGHIRLGNATEITLDYAAFGNFTKFGAFALGKAVPEPGSMGLLMLGIGSILGATRRRRTR